MKQSKRMRGIVKEAMTTFGQAEDALKIRTRVRATFCGHGRTDLAIVSAFLED
jgi:hypothetical protein